MKIKQSRQKSVINLLVFAKLFMLGSISILFIAVTIGAYLLITQPNSIAGTSSTSDLSRADAHGTRHTHSHKGHPVSPGHYANQVTALGQSYMHALLQQKYNVMWSLLHPDVQALWPDQAAFASYLKTRFHSFGLQNFTLGPVQDLSFWVNPESMLRYNQVESIPVSLQLTPQVPPAALTQLPQPDQNPSQTLQNIPLIVQRTTIGTGQGEGNQWRILNSGPTDLEAPLLPPITPVYTTANVPILMYHYISPAPLDDANYTLRLSLSIDPTTFTQQLDYLKQQGYHTITVNQLMDALYYNGPLPNKPIILTFDDGYSDAYTHAYPILQAHGYSGMFYIITGKVGWKDQATWDQLREMLANGMQMGSHTINHRNIGSLWQISHTEAQQELQLSQQTLQQQLGSPIQHFCYPNGDPFKEHDTALQQQIVTLLASLGYIDATTDPGPTGTLQQSQTPFALLRLRIDGRNSLDTYKNMLHAYL